MKTISTLSTAELRRIERDIEQGTISKRSVLEPMKSILLGGVRAEIESRSHVIRVYDGSSAGPVQFRVYH